jgi:hypothetical protein
VPAELLANKCSILSGLNIIYQTWVSSPCGVDVACSGGKDAGRHVLLVQDEPLADVVGRGHHGRPDGRRLP